MSDHDAVSGPSTGDPTTGGPTTGGPTTGGPWRPDILDGWLARDLDLPAGAIATLVRPAHPAPRPAGATDPAEATDPADATDPAAPTKTAGATAPANAATLAGSAPQPATGVRPAVLYVHGYSDYFFHPHLAAAFTARGYPFYAVDLRGHGRSIGRGSGAPDRPGDDPGFTTVLAAYAEDIDAALRVIRAEHPAGGPPVLLGHSTGGLVAALWAHARPGRLAALVLNSPWVDLNASWVNRVISTRVIDVVGRAAPRLPVGRLGAHYARALHRSTGGEWDFDVEWKPLVEAPARAGWLRQVRRGHARLARGLAIGCPVLVARSARSGPNTTAHAELLTTDSVLDVAHIRDRAGRLGPDVTHLVIEGGAHDLALSPEPARSSYLTGILDWLDARVGPVAG